jgi:hypothetical protein
MHAMDTGEVFPAHARTALPVHGQPTTPTAPDPGGAQESASLLASAAPPLDPESAPPVVESVPPASAGPPEPLPEQLVHTAAVQSATLAMARNAREDPITLVRTLTGRT